MVIPDLRYGDDDGATAVKEDCQRECEALACQVARAGWQIVTAVHSPSGVELHLLPGLYVWDFPRLGRRLAYGRDDQDALRRFVRQLEAAAEPAAGPTS
jgi:hypothetical protein